MNGRIMTIDIVTAEEAGPEGRSQSEPFIAAGVKAQARSGRLSFENDADFVWHKEKARWRMMLVDG
jgi:hypothetical protein